LEEESTAVGRKTRQKQSGGRKKKGNQGGKDQATCGGGKGKIYSKMVWGGKSLNWFNKKYSGTYFVDFKIGEF